MRIEEFIREVETEATKRSYIRDTQIISQGAYTVKMWMIITPDLKVQLYHNEKTGTTNLSLLLHDERIYGRNKRKGTWHRHPIERPMEHDISQEGAKPATIAQFLEEVDKILIERKLI